MNRAVNLTFVEKYSFGLGAIGKDMVFNIVTGFYMLYLTLVVGLDPLVVGIVFALARGWDAFNDPIMGTIVDNTRSRWGKFRPWLVIGTLSNAVIVILMHTDFNLGSTGEYVFYLSIYVIWGMTYTIVDIPYWSLIPAISGTKEERNQVSSIARIFASAGGAVTAGAVPIVLGTYGYANSVFLTIAFAVSGFFIVFMAFTVCFTKEKIIVIGEKIRLREIIKIFKSNDQLLAYIYTFGLYAIAGTIMNNSGIYYFKVVLDREELMTLFLIIGGVGGTGVSMILYPFFARKFNRRNIYIFAMLATIVGFSIMSVFSFAFGGAEAALIGVFFGGWLVFFAQGIAMVGSTVMLADVVDYGEWKTGNRTENITFSMQCFLYKFASAVSAIIIGIALRIGDIPLIDPAGMFVGDVTDAGKNALIFVIFTLPVLFTIPATYFYIKKYKLNGKYHDDILEELYRKRDLKEAREQGKQEPINVS